MIFLCVCIYFFFLSFQKPWRFDECNLFDIVIHLCVLGFVFICQGLLFKKPETSDVMALVNFSMYFPFVLAFLAVAALAYQHFKPMTDAERKELAEGVVAAMQKIEADRERFDAYFKGLTRQEQRVYL